MAKKDPSARAKAFKRWMQARDLNTKRVAREADIPYTTLASFMQGDTQTLKGDAESKIATTYRCTPAEVFEGASPSRRLVPIVGRAGADPSGKVLYARGDATNEYAEAPAGSNNETRAILVVGDSMKGLVDDGGLLFFERQGAPTPDMFGEPVVVETDGDEVMVKRLQGGSAPGYYDLESINGPRRRNVGLRWVARITAIVPPWKAKQIIERGIEAA